MARLAALPVDVARALSADVRDALLQELQTARHRELAAEREQVWRRLYDHDAAANASSDPRDDR